MTDFDELEKVIQVSRVKYSLDSDDGRKKYTIFSESLKNSLRNSIHAACQRDGWKGWQTKQVMGTNFTEYAKEQDGKFGLYRKFMAGNSPDEFVILAKGKNSAEREVFAKLSRDNEEIREKSGGDNYISWSIEWNKEGEIVETKKVEVISDYSRGQEIREISDGAMVVALSPLTQEEKVNFQKTQLLLESTVEGEQDFQAIIRQNEAIIRQNEEQLKNPYFLSDKGNK